MNKLLLIDKPKNYTSRDIVNILMKKFNTKKIGHFGTLDPLATGLLVIGLGKYTKLNSLSFLNDKEYICELKVGTSTTTYDITGKIIKDQKEIIDKNIFLKAIKHFTKTYDQEVPIYSAVKVKGKKLYEYARNNEEVTLPKKKITIYQIDLLKEEIKDDRQYFTINVKASKGTYLRSLVNDLSIYLNTPLVMTNLRRVKQGIFSLEKANTLKDIENDHYKTYNLEVFLNITKIKLNKDNEKAILNGVEQHLNNKTDLIMYTKDNKDLVLYKKSNYSNDTYKVFFFL